MSLWQAKYKSKIVTADEAVKNICSDQKIYLSGNCSVPEQLIGALVTYGDQVSNVNIYQPLTVTGSDYVSPQLNGHLRVNSLFISPNVRQAVNEGRADYTPVLLSELPLLFKKDVLPLDIALVHLSPPDDHGFCTFGVEAGLTITAAESARMVIAEINQQMPVLLGDTRIHIDKIDCIVPVDYPVKELDFSSEKQNPVITEIASHIAPLIPDGATLQMGIGSIPNALLKFLFEKKDLGIHTELFSDTVIDLVEAGVLTGARKSIHPGKIIAGFLLGTRRLYEWVNNNPLVEIHRTEYVNSPFVIAQNDRMVAINSAIEVDLTGQVCSDSIGTTFYSGVGGQMDFIYGSSLAKEGIPIIALPSTTINREGKIFSRIVLHLKTGAGVVTTRNHVHFIATEYGIVDLYGKSIRQRAQLLISIAHPMFRDELKFHAHKLNYL